MRNMHWFILVALFVVHTSAAQTTLNVEVILNKPEAGGLLRVVLCPDKAAYDSEVGCRLQSVEATGHAVRCSFGDVKPGIYAVKVFHDINADNELNTSWIGWPQEPYGFSNDAPVNTGPPSFRLAAFEVKEKEMTTRIALR
ncbi:MAG: DUF2141 domain-containing protein [Flavobacteriales bacterium]|jgi:uncharacterized protein (DUF2141 family)|nr:DUF2141 domain-containing protein [Flavobacteriales bacterium]MBK7484506.1 DUF2141 domain-containing protein [Flavobacteriales bacterium]